MTKKRGLPRALQEELDDELSQPEQTPEEFVKEFFGDTAKPQDDKGLPSSNGIVRTTRFGPKPILSATDI